MYAHTPKQIVEELDKYIIAQDEAKKSIAIALRNRYRRLSLEPNIRNEISPKNILMVGSTGVGKTEIARRIAKMTGSPFVKVEASKYTEVGYVGRDVESMIRDLTEVSVNLVKDQLKQKFQTKAEEQATERLLDILLPNATAGQIDQDSASSTRDKFKVMLENGDLEEREVEVELKAPKPHVEVLGGMGQDDFANDLQDMFRNLMPQKKTLSKMKVKEARKALFNEELNNIIEKEDIRSVAINLVETQGIVFLDEIDKICVSDRNAGQVSREGVQRDLLPIVEGSSVTTKYGSVNTDHILFIAAGAFHKVKPNDLIAELQGRFPIRVELKSLEKKHFVKILKEPEYSLVKQYQALLSVENLVLEFDDSGIDAIAEKAYQVNSTIENIGARRLHTLMEKLLEEPLFSGNDLGDKLLINKEYVDQKLESLVADRDLSKYIL